MIFPWLKGVLLYTKAPITWMIVLLNFFIFLVVWDSERKSDQFFEEPLQLINLGKLYYLSQNPANNVPLEKKSYWYDQAQLALRDPHFLERAKVQNFKADPIETERIFKELAAYRLAMDEKWSSQFGLNNFSSSYLNWITYQFMHASWTHLFGNMMMLLIFGSALELMMGSLSFISLYLLSGIVGAFFFSVINQVSLAPMVGASGALSGLIAFYAIFEIRKRVSFFYFISPLPGYFGQIYLPTWLIFPMIFLADIHGILNIAESGTGIAYAAHLGGATCGLVLGGILRLSKNWPQIRWLLQR